MSRHTPAPWTYHTEGKRAFVLEADGTTIFEVAKPWMNDACFDAARIVKCVNALKDLPDGALDVGWCYSGMQAYTVGLENEVARLKSELAEAKKVPDGMSLVRLTDIVDAKHYLEKATEWNGKGWNYNLLHPMFYRPAIELLGEMIDAAPEYKP